MTKFYVKSVGADPKDHAPSQNARRNMARDIQSNFKHATYDNVVWRYFGTESATAKRAMTGQHPCAGMYWTPKGQDPEAAHALLLFCRFL
jgi:hypothetical protein